jgi:hypothetical protein
VGVEGGIRIAVHGRNRHFDRSGEIFEHGFSKLKDLSIALRFSRDDDALFEYYLQKLSIYRNLIKWSVRTQTTERTL